MIREATPKDLAAILEIYNEAILNTTAVYAYDFYTEETGKAWYEGKINKGYPFFVEEIDGKVVGFATYGSFRSKAAYQYTIEHSIYVHPDHRRRGIARMLMEKLLAAADKEGYATMVAGIDSENEGSIRLHEQLGFRNTGTIRRAGFKFGRWLDLVFYQRMLKGPADPVEK